MRGRGWALGNSPFSMKVGALGSKSGSMVRGCEILGFWIQGFGHSSAWNSWPRVSMEVCLMKMTYYRTIVSSVKGAQGHAGFLASTVAHGALRC